MADDSRLLVDRLKIKIGMRQILKEKLLPPNAFKKFSEYLPWKEPPLKGKRIIPVCEPDISGNEEKYIIKAVKSSWISSAGEYVSLFEEKFANKISITKYAVAVNSGTTALHTILAACGIGPEDEVIAPAFTMIATINAVSYCGAKTILVDADPFTWNIDSRLIEKKITKKTRAIIAVHIYGLPADMTAILAIAKKYNLWVIEDAAEAHGAKYYGNKVGSIGDIGGFSLYANKIITTGEGGMITTNNARLAERVRTLINSSFSSERHFWHKTIGYGYRMTNLQGAVGLAQVERFDDFFDKKQKIARWYKKKLEKIPGIRFQEVPPNIVHSHWMNGILINKSRFGIDKNRLCKFLAEKGIETRSFFVPIHIQPVYYHFYKKERFPVAEKLCRDGLYLPSSARLTEMQIDRIVRVIVKARSQ